MYNPRIVRLLAACAIIMALTQPTAVYPQSSQQTVKQAKKACLIAWHSTKVGAGALAASYWAWVSGEFLTDTRNSKNYGIRWGGLIDTPKGLCKNIFGSWANTPPILATACASCVAIASGIQGLKEIAEKNKDNDT